MIFGRNRFLRDSRTIQRKNFGHLLACKRFIWAAISVAMSVLANHVRAIIRSGSKHQMIGIAARRIIAFVKNKHSDRNRSNVQYPTRNVRQNLIAAMPAPRQRSVLRNRGPGPFPAAANLRAMGRNVSVLVNVVPESSPEGEIKPLRKRRVLWDFMVGHNQVLLDCVRLRVLQHAGATTLKEYQTITLSAIPNA